MLVDVGTIEVRMPLDTMVDAVRVIVTFALIVVGIKTVVDVPVEVEVDITGLVRVTTVVIGFRMDVKVPLETTVVAV